jgi:hypothetical protein
MLIWLPALTAREMRASEICGALVHGLRPRPPACDIVDVGVAWPRVITLPAMAVMGARV